MPGHIKCTAPDSSTTFFLESWASVSIMPDRAFRAFTTFLVSTVWVMVSNIAFLLMLISKGFFSHNPYGHSLIGEFQLRYLASRVALTLSRSFSPAEWQTAMY